MDFDSQVERIIKKNPGFQEAIGRNPELRSRLRNIVEDNYDNYKGLLRWAKFVDIVNIFLGPTEAILGCLAPLGTNLFGLYSATKLLHYAIIKLPYVVYYTTRKLKGAGALLMLAEIAKYITPCGTAADLVPIYSYSAKHYLKKKSADEFKQYLVEIGPGKPI